MAYSYEYWTSLIPALWDDTAAWSTFSGGPGGVHAPDSTTVAVFDAFSIGECTIASSAVAAGLRMSDGTIFQNAPLSVSGDPAGLSVNGGVFFGASSDITANGFFLGTGLFMNTSATLHLMGTSMFGSAWADSGTVAIHAGSSTDWSGVQIGNLQVSDGSGQYSTVSGTCVVTETLSLASGRLKRGSTDQTVVLRGDLACAPSFGSWDSRNDAYILMDASGPQAMAFGAGGGIVPSLTVDKTTGNPVTCTGTGPVNVNGDLNLLDGTFNLNGLGLKVGA